MEQSIKHSILIVDDEAQNIHLLYHILKEKYQIFFATSGEQALERLDANPLPDMILLDVVMPDINGFEVCKRIKNNPKTKDIPIIFVTAKDSEQDETKGLACGAVDFITKPIRQAIVLARIASQLALQEQKQQIKRNEALLKSTLEATKDGIAAFDNQGKVLLLNQNFINMWNFPSEIIASNDINRILAYGLSQVVDKECRQPHLQEVIQSDEKEADILELIDGRVFSRYTQPLFLDELKVGRVVSYSDISEQKKLELQLITLSVTDSLTGLFNRRKLEEILHAEFYRAQRYQKDLAVIMLDLDHFKNINDSYGHEQGDRILQQLSLEMKQHFRSVDWCCRYGGEEFLVIMPDSSLDGALDSAERFRRLIESMMFDELKITLSMGISVFSNLEKNDLAENLIAQADQALYQAKNTGRNKVCSFKSVL